MTMRVSAEELRRFARNAAKADPVARRALRDGARAAGELVAVDARQRADWSTRIPGSTRVRVVGATAVVSAGGSQAPHAAAYEHEGRDGTFRHPVNAWARPDRGEWKWGAQQARPFLRPALDAQGDAAVELIAGSVHRGLLEVLG